jgi:hypothetical protein
MAILAFTEIAPSMVGDRDPFLLMHSAGLYLMEREKEIAFQDNSHESKIARAEVLWAACTCIGCASKVVTGEEQ